MTTFNYMISYQIIYNCLKKANKLRFKDSESVRLSVDYSDEAQAINFNGNVQITLMQKVLIEQVPSMLPNYLQAKQALFLRLKITIIEQNRRYVHL